MKRLLLPTQRVCTCGANAMGKDFQEWIQYDIEYVRRMGPWLDLRICLQTVRNILVRRHTGA